MSTSKKRVQYEVFGEAKQRTVILLLGEFWGSLAKVCASSGAATDAVKELRCVKDWVRNGPLLRYAKKKF